MRAREVQAVLEHLRAVGDDTSRIEVKRAEREVPKRLWESVSAFANANGGLILLGIDATADYAPAGVANAARAQRGIAEVFAVMVPPVRRTIDVATVEGAQIVVAEVPAAPTEQRPCYYGPSGMATGSFIRVADGDRRLTGYEIQLMLANHGQPRDDEAPVADASKDDLDPRLVSALLARRRGMPGSRFHSLDDDEALRTMRVLVRLKDRLVPSVAGLLALGEYPQRFFASLRVTLVVYPGRSVGEPGPLGERFLDNVSIEGSIIDMVTGALAALKRNMTQRSIVRGIFREELWEYPESAVREAVVNALAHRDLSGQALGSPVQIQKYADRLVILNPGGLHGSVRIDQLGQVGVSSTRSQWLMRLLEDVTYPGETRAICENRGSGIGAMIAALRAAGMSPPEFRDDVSSFMVTFPNHTLLDEATLDWLRQRGGAGLADSQIMALAVMRRGGSMANEDYRRLTGVDSRIATRELRDLVDRGLVDRTSARRWATYRLTTTETVPQVRRRRQDRRQAILGLLAQRGDLSRHDLAVALGLSDDAIKGWLVRLRAEGAIEPTTERLRSPRVRYRLSRHG